MKVIIVDKNGQASLPFDDIVAIRTVGKRLKLFHKVGQLNRITEIYSCPADCGVFVIDSNENFTDIEKYIKRWR